MRSILSWLLRRQGQALVQLVLAGAAIGSLIYTGLALRTQNYLADIERTPVLYVACQDTQDAPQHSPSGPVFYPGFDFYQVWRAFPKMKSLNGQAMAIFPSASVEECALYNYGRLPAIDVRLPIVARLLKGPTWRQHCTSVPCSFDYAQNAAVEITMYAPTAPTSAFTIAPGGVRTFVIGNHYRQWLEFEFLDKLQVIVPPDSTTRVVPLIVGSFESAHLVSPGTDCPPAGWPRTSRPMINGVPRC